jgi:hypothetical protein
LSQLRKLAAADIHVVIEKNGTDLTSRDAVLAAAGAFRPGPGGWNVDFVDADVRVNSDATAQAFATADVTTSDPETGSQTIDSRDVSFLFVRRDGEWLVSGADVKDPAKTQ